jgi:hypothetical protein
MLVLIRRLFILVLLMRALRPYVRVSILNKESKRPSGFWSWLGRSKDQLTIILAVVGIPFITYQYFQTKLENRITNSLTYITKQEEKEIQASRTNLIDFIMSDSELSDLYKKNECFKDSLITTLRARVYKTEDSRKTYFKDFYALHNLYSDAATCAITGRCDLYSMCSSLAPQMQFFRNSNDGVYDSINGMFHDYRSSQIDEFLHACDDKDFAFADEDGSSICRAWLFFRQITMTKFTTVCRKKREPRVRC